jgi:WS/DGAT/MGAT family acyltransferase
MQQLTGQDASFLYFETPLAPMHVAGLTIYEQSTVPGGLVRFKDILRHIEGRLPRARAFRQKVVRVPFDLDHPWWVEDRSFDIEFHVRHIALPRPGDWRQLCIQAARLHSRPLDPSRPLWEFTIIEGLDGVAGLPPGCFALLTKIHHAAVDGVSGVELTAALHDVEPVRSTPDEDTWRPERVPGSVQLLTKAWVNNAKRPVRLARVVGRTVPGVGRAIGVLRDRSEGTGRTRVPRTRFNGTVSAHRVFDGVRFELADVARIRKAVPGATVNDVVLTIVGGALRRYLESKGELPDDPLVAMAPISVRSESEQGTAGNRVSAMLVPLGTNVAEPLERLAAVYTGTQASKELTNAIGADVLTDYQQFIPGSLAGLAARLSSRMGLANRGAPMFNCVVTNVPGPQRPLYLNGARAVAMYGLGPIGDGNGLIHGVLSYNGQLTVSVTSCRDMLPDPAFYARCIEESVAELVAAASSRDVVDLREGRSGELVGAAAGPSRSSPTARSGSASPPAAVTSPSAPPSASSPARPRQARTAAQGTSG